MTIIRTIAALWLTSMLLACAAPPERPGAAAGAAAFPGDMTPAQMAAERQRIDRVRNVEEARFAAAEAACYQRFAVNDCLTAVQRERRAVREELRRQAIALNDIERAQRAADHLRSRAGPDGKLPPLPLQEPVVVPAGLPALAPATSVP